MLRPASLRALVWLISSLIVAHVAIAAPAPVYKPKLSKVWITGWDKPSDPVEDCRFDRNGDKLTIIIPAGKTHISHTELDPMNLPSLMRDVEQDFVVQVRVTGDFRRTIRDGSRQAGIFMMAGETNCTASRLSCSFGPDYEDELRLTSFIEQTSTTYLNVENPSSKSVYLRLERQGKSLRAKISHDGSKWKTIIEKVAETLPRKMKVGVAAGAESDVPFYALFDQFELTPLK